MTTRTTLIAAGLTGLALTGAAHGQEKNFDLSGFTGVDIATGIEARITQAETFSVIARSRSADALDKLELEVRGGVLVARIESNFLDFILSGGLVGMLLSGGNAVSLDISVPALESALASSGADIELVDIMSDSLELDASSGANIELTEARLRALSASASSGSDIALSGSAEDIALNASSGADIDAEALEAVSGRIEASSGADIDVRITQQVRARASSGADITIEGNPQQRDVESSSGGDIHFDN
ncbi:DUF2807 domain-containing protein [uncultured Devosia sp.]|uniref:GIN domain-containing protein n=1 Tax=uncultured Devosia sp. TaxID=211434 RepID=UPI002636F799|nr:DUF2807 domain-containing protein [uncultured Devosia sp.]